jgi:signal transduction histidine kinase
MEHIGSPLDRALTLLSQAKLNLEVARQNERLEIVRDLSELLIQRVGAVLSLTEGGSYAVKQNPEVAGRVLERASEAAKSAQLELRRLFDLLHTDSVAGGLTPRLADLDALVIAYRELGYNAELRTEGATFGLDEGAEMCLYKIVFESLDNVRKHTQRGTNVTIEFTWVDPGLQLMIKDNGIEFEARERVQLGELIDGYGVEEDLNALVQQLDGSTLNAMRERAALYEGSVEATLEPGVGFTVSAIFPNLRTVIEGR